MQLRTASRQKAKLRIGLAGPSGSGKTYSALLLANGLCPDWTKIAVIDTENMSADLYCDLGDYQVLTLQSPYTPERYIEAINTCEQSGIEVIIIDSMSHEWDGRGGCLQIHESLTGNSYTNWAKVTPRHNNFIDAILKSSCHIICTMRSKTDVVMSEKNGKAVPEKVGLKAVTREGVEYEFTLVFDLDIKNNANCAKDRTQLFKNQPEKVLNNSDGQKLANWAQNETLASESQVTQINQLCKMIEQDKQKILEFSKVKEFKDLSYIKACEIISLLEKKLNSKADLDSLMRIQKALVLLEKNEITFLKNHGLGEDIKQIKLKQAIELEQELEQEVIKKQQNKKEPLKNPEKVVSEDDFTNLVKNYS